jgi:hypothetical protein
MANALHVSDMTVDLRLIQLSKASISPESNTFFWTRALGLRSIISRTK